MRIITTENPTHLMIRFPGVYEIGRKNMETFQKYKETGNTEFLADVANFAMIEFMFPQHEKKNYKPTDSGACETAGFGVNEIKGWEG
jgi:hypothetical protein